MKKLFTMALIAAAFIVCLSSCSLFACKHKNVEIDAAVTATCTQAGLTEGKHCAKCGEILVKQEVVPLAHNFGEWEIIKAADCFYSGEKVRSCTTCNTKENVTIASIAHDFEQDPESKLFSCTACEATIFAGNLYKVFDVEVNWYDAYKTCDSIGGHLVTITSKLEQNFLTQVIEGRDLKFVKDGEYFYFTGAIENSNGWEWITGEEFIYTNWGAQGHDNATAQWHMGLTSELKLNKNSKMNIGEWEDIAHTNPEGFICEWKLDITETEHYFTEWEATTLADCFGDGEEWRICTHCGLEETRVVKQLEHNFIFNEATGVTACEHCNASLYNGHIYKIFNVSLSWFDAYTYCNDLGGHLVTITSQEEQTFIETYMNSQSFTSYAWIGAYNDGVKWQWITGEDFEYKNWTSGQPDCQDGCQFFTIINYLSVGKWDDRSPLQSHSYLICEWEAE